MAIPGGPFRYFEDPETLGLRQPLALLAFGGWVDAGSAGTGALRFLGNGNAARKVADLDAEDFYSYTDTRPLTSVAGPGQRVIHWPRGEMHAVTLPEEAPRDLVLFTAPEPNLRWRTFITALLDELQRVGVTTLMSVGSIFGSVHHRAAVPLTGWATEQPLRETLLRHDITFTDYEGPTGIVTAVIAEAQARSLPAAAIIGFAPNYIQGVPNPRVSYALLRAVSGVTGIPLDLSDLEKASRVLTRQVDKLLGSQPELREQVERMLQLSSMADLNVTGTDPETGQRVDERSPRSSAPDPDSSTNTDPLPSPQAVVKELEDFLKQLNERGRGNGPEQGGPTP